MKILFHKNHKYFVYKFTIIFMWQNNQYLKSLESRKKQKDEIHNMKNDIDEIKSLLKILVEGNNKS